MEMQPSSLTFSSHHADIAAAVVHDRFANESLFNNSPLLAGHHLACDDDEARLVPGHSGSPEPLRENSQRARVSVQDLGFLLIECIEEAATG
jgi:hypothetical protein